MRRAATVLSIVVLIAACGLTPPAVTPSMTPSASGEVTASPDASSAAPSAEPEATATPGPDTVPRFTAGSLVVTNAPGLRVRSRPGTEQRVVTSLGVDAELLVGLGPVMVDGIGWYQVRDADAGAPEFFEGWVAAGFEPDPFLISAGFAPDDNPFLAGFADTAAGEFGPVSLPEDAEVSMRWIAATNGTELCSFSVDLDAGGGEPVRAVRTPVGNFPASGELPSGFFASNPVLAGNLFVVIESECSWAISFVEARPVGQASPS